MAEVLDAGDLVVVQLQLRQAREPRPEGRTLLHYTIPLGVWLPLSGRNTGKVEHLPEKKSLVYLGKHSFQLCEFPSKTNF